MRWKWVRFMGNLTETRALLWCALFTQSRAFNLKFNSLWLSETKRCWLLPLDWFFPLVFSDGSLKYRNSISQYHPGNGYTNPCLQVSTDQISTISRPRSAIDAIPHCSGSLYEDLDFPLMRKRNVSWSRPHVSLVLSGERYKCDEASKNDVWTYRERYLRWSDDERK